MFRVRSTALVILALLGAGFAQAQEARMERRVLAMGTSLGMELSGPTPSHLQAASEKALEEVARIEANLSTWRGDSVFGRLNQAQGAEVSLEGEWLGLLQRVQGQAHRTGGAFDPLLWPLVQAWGLREGGRRPSEMRLRKARQASGVQWLRLDPKKGTAQLLHASAGIEEGGFGKGYALDRAATTAKGSGATSGLLDFGGQLLAFGQTQTVSLANPADRLRPRLSVHLTNASLASTGTSEKGGHILDPKTGRPCRTWGSVAVIAPSGLEADTLSTALYVMGPRQGLQWAAVHGLPACFLLTNGQIRMSPAFRALAPSLF